MRSGERICRSSVGVKAWQTETPTVSAVRPAQCSGCGAASRPAGRNLVVHGDGTRERQHQVRTIALPLVSTGLRGYPVDAAARVAVQTVAAALKAAALPERAIQCAFTSDASAALRAAWSEAAAPSRFESAP
jgi:hypothetical protein